MRIHSDILTASQIALAGVKLTGVTISATTRKSRSHRGAWDVYMTGNGITGGQWGNMPAGAKSATWDEWGAVLAYLFAIDPEMVCGSVGSPIYSGVDHFVWTTSARFDTDGTLPEDAHARHKWEFQGQSLGGGYYVHACKKCTAQTRRPASGYEWADFA